MRIHLAADLELDNGANSNAMRTTAQLVGLNTEGENGTGIRVQLYYGRLWPAYLYEEEDAEKAQHRAKVLAASAEAQASQRGHGSRPSTTKGRGGKKATNKKGKPWSSFTSSSLT